MMIPIRKPYQGDPLFPFEIVYKATKSPQLELPDHLHDLYELVYVHQGKGTFFIDNSFHEKKAGDLFIIPGNTIHRAFPDQDEPIVSSALFFSPALVQSKSMDPEYASLGCFELARKRHRYRIELSDPARKAVEAAVDLIAEELQQRQAGYREAALLRLCLLLLDVNRIFQPAEEGDSISAYIGPPWMKEALLTIDSHAGSRIGLSELAAQAAVSPAHFSRVFKQFTGLNVTDYVNAKRIVRAKEMILNGSDSISQVAEHCGFETLPHFYRVFKAVTGRTPATYKRMQTSPHEDLPQHSSH